MVPADESTLDAADLAPFAISEKNLMMLPLPSFVSVATSKSDDRLVIFIPLFFITDVLTTITNVI